MTEKHLTASFFLYEKHIRKLERLSKAKDESMSKILRGAIDKIPEPKKVKQ